MGIDNSKYAASPFCQALQGSSWQTRVPVPLWVVDPSTDPETLPVLGRKNSVKGAVYTTLSPGAVFTITRITPQTMPKASYAPYIIGYLHPGWNLEGLGVGQGKHECFPCSITPDWFSERGYLTEDFLETIPAADTAFVFRRD